ncbi:MAG: protease pro-enzyme activation domain-containing protein, partial [Dehalococcoidia bacterium]
MRLPGHVLPALAQAASLPAGAAGSSGSDPLTLTLTLNRTDQSGFDALLNRLQDPHSPDYQHFLTQQQLADRFGPSQGAYDTVLGWLQGQGFSLLEGSANRLTLTVQGTRQQAERAFSVQIKDYALTGRTFYANDRDPVLPATIAKDVQAVQGLANLAQPSAPRAPGRAVARAFRLAICNFFSDEPVINPLYPQLPPTHPKQDCINSVYADFGKDPPFLQKIGLLEFDSFRSSDITDYLTYLGSPATISQVTKVDVNGGVVTPGTGEDEVLLDIDLALTVDPNANIVVYDAPASGVSGSFQMLFNRMVSDGMNVISNSWSYCEDETTLSDFQSIDSIYAGAAAS